MAMTTAVAGTSTPVIQRHFLGSGAQALRPQQPRASAHHLTNAITSKLNVDKAQVELGTNVIAGTLFASLATFESASAAQQILQLAAADASDSRGLALLVPLVPAVGWVLFNILQPGLNQFNRMKNAKGVAIGLGLGAFATLGLSSTASAAAAMQEVAELAEGDSRGLLVLGLIVAAVGWVLFNIFQPALNQFNRMKSTKGIVGAVGVGAAAAAAGLASVQAADAAGLQEVASIAEEDNRGLLLLLVVLPALGWVLFNILQPALNQLNRMQTTSSPSPSPESELPNEGRYTVYGEVPGKQETKISSTYAV